MWEAPVKNYRTSVGLDVHARSVVGCGLDGETGEVFERRLTPELESRLIERLTETLIETLEAPELRSHTWVIVEGHDAHRWGRNAKPWDEGGN